MGIPTRPDQGQISEHLRALWGCAYAQSYTRAYHATSQGHSHAHIQPAGQSVILQTNNCGWANSQCASTYVSDQRKVFLIKRKNPNYWLKIIAHLRNVMFSLVGDSERCAKLHDKYSSLSLCSKNKTVNL